MTFLTQIISNHTHPAPMNKNQLITVARLGLSEPKFNKVAKLAYIAVTTLGAMMFFGITKAVGETADSTSLFRNTFSNLTINSAAPIDQSIQTRIPPQAQQMFGGITQISCSAGQAPATCMPMGFFNTAFGTGRFTPQSAATAAGQPALSGSQTLASVTPWLGNIAVKDALAGNPELGRILPSGVTSNPSIMNAKLGNVVNLSAVSLNRVPSLATTPFNNFAGIQAMVPAQFPNLGSISFANMPTFQQPGAGIALIKMDLVRTNERNINNLVMSGSELQPNAPCATNCDYIETLPLAGIGVPRGAKLISGDSLQVQGGSGLLRWVNGGVEPTGVRALGMKFVIRRVNAKRGTAVVNLNFRTCFYFFGQHCTPYFMGFPLWQISEKYPGIPILTTDTSVSRVLRLTR